jgi:hypothetical protein
LISWRIPTYLISDFEMREILAPINSDIMEDGRARGKEGRRMGRI